MPCRAGVLQTVWKLCSVPCYILPRESVPGRSRRGQRENQESLVYLSSHWQPESSTLAGTEWQLVPAQPLLAYRPILFKAPFRWASHVLLRLRVVIAARAPWLELLASSVLLTAPSFRGSVRRVSVWRPRVVIIPTTSSLFLSALCNSCFHNNLPLPLFPFQFSSSWLAIYIKLLGLMRWLSR